MTHSIVIGTTEPLRHAHTIGGSLVPSASISYTITDVTTGYVLATTGTVFSALVGGDLTGHLRVLTESIAQPGIYEGAWDTTGIPAGDYVYTVHETAPTARVLRSLEFEMVAASTDTIAADGFAAQVTASGLAQTYLDALDTKVTNIGSAVGVLNVFITSGVPTTTVVTTSCTFPDGTFAGHILWILDPFGTQRTAGARILSQVGGVFTLETPLPWAPGIGDEVTVSRDPAPAVAGDAMALTSGERATTAGVIASAVWSFAVDAWGDASAALTLLRRRQTNRRKLGVTGGVTSFYADDGTTVEAIATITDTASAAFVPASGEAAESSAES